MRNFGFRISDFGFADHPPLDEFQIADFRFRMCRPPTPVLHPVAAAVTCRCPCSLTLILTLPLALSLPLLLIL
jgi:hypothetical protein